jgi:hypothetical protein
METVPTYYYYYHYADLVHTLTFRWLHNLQMLSLKH